MTLSQLLTDLGVRFNENRDGNQMVKCMVHDDSHASCSVNLGKQVWNCKACGAGGTVVDLLMATQGLSLKAALDAAGRDNTESRQPRKGRGHKFRLKKRVQW